MEILSRSVKLIAQELTMCAMWLLQDTARLWLTKKWDEGEPVVENLLATLEDYFVDLKQWISGSFFFSKVVRQCLNECAKEYVNRLVLRTHCFANPTNSSSTVENDYKVCHFH
jgi:exocyst complex component 3